MCRCADDILDGSNNIFDFGGNSGNIYSFFTRLFFGFLGILAYGIGEGFERIDLVFLLIMTIFALISPLLDWLGIILGAKKAKASWVSILIGIISGILGLIIFSLAGFLIFSFLAVVISELVISKKQIRQAFSVGLGSLVGFLISAIIKVLIIFLMIGLFLGRVF
jgi:hypothetical protein